MSLQNKETFQKRHKLFFLTTSAFGFYTPGIEELLPHPALQRVLLVYAWFTALLCVGYLLVFLIYVLRVTMPPLTIILIARRTICVAPYCFKLVVHMIPSRRNKLAELFATWNNSINNHFYEQEREKIFTQKLRATWLATAFSMGGVLLVQIPVCILFLSPYFDNSRTHAWYDYIGTLAQMALFLLSNMSGGTFNACLCIILSMAATQLQLLRESLKAIFSKITINNNGEMFIKEEHGPVPLTFEKYTRDLQRVRCQMLEWIMEHRKTIQWLDEIKLFFRYTASVKLLFFGAYISLAVFSIPVYLKQGSINDFVLILCYIQYNFSILFHETRLSDQVHENSMILFDETYDSAWFIYPKDVTKSLHIIAARSITRPEDIRAFSIVKDNSANFLAMIQLAYKALSFLVHLQI